MLFFRVRKPALAAALLLVSACVNGEIGAPFGYAEDRCAGSQNQCQTECASLDGDGPARSACMQRCFTLEDRCYATGDDSATSMAVDRSVGEARSRREMEEDFQRWKREKAKEKESAEKQEAGTEE
ncbi:MAG: hypothetical protein VX640_11500 [Pseudomonadota bacterium]|nr:hypothetical protein [Pseudomonadota bacterium]